MNEVNKTMYIPLYGKAYVSKKGILLNDPKTEQIWAAEGFPLKGKSRSKWLAYYMAMRAAVYDRWVEEKLAEKPNAVVLHIGCGMDSRAVRVDRKGRTWYDIDFADVIEERKRYFREADGYHMIVGDAREETWLAEIEGEEAIVVMEGVSMYLAPGERQKLLERLCGKFTKIYLLADFYTHFAAKMSKVRNPINDVGVTLVYGLDDPLEAETSELKFVKRHDMTPADMIGELSGMERAIFRKLYAGKIADKMYRMYEYERG